MTTTVPRHPDAVLELLDETELRTVTEHELNRMRRDGAGLSLIWVVIVPRRLQLVDTDAPPVDEHVRSSIAAALRMELRSSDVVAAVADDELAVLCPDTNPDGIAAVAEMIYGVVIEFAPGRNRGLTARMGVASVPPGEPRPSYEFLAAQARVEALGL